MEFVPDKKEVSFVPDSANSEESAYQKYVPEAIKNAVGGIESVGRGIYNFPVTSAVQPIGTLAGLATGKGIEGAVEQGQNWAEKVSIPPLTKQGGVADEMVGAGIDALRNTAGDYSTMGETYNPNAPAGSARANPRLEAVNRFTGEGVFDILMGRAGLSLGKAGLTSSYKAVQDYRTAKVDAVARENAHKAIEGKANQTAYDEGLNKNEDAITRYPTDTRVSGNDVGGRRQAAQYGVGGKVKPLHERQAEYEADLKAIYEEQSAARKAEIENAGKPVPNTFYVDRQGAAMGELPPAHLQQGMEAVTASERTRLAGEVPVEPPQPDIFQKGLEITQRGGPPETWNMGQGEVPSVDPQGNWTTNEGVRPVRARDATDIQMDPLQRVVAVDILSDPKYQRDVTRLERVHQEISDLTRQYDDPVVQRGLQMNEALGLNKARQVSEALDRKNAERIRLEARTMAATEWAGEIATRTPLKVEKTTGWDGPHQTVKVNFWDRLTSGVSNMIDRANGGNNHGPRGKQSGQVSTDLLTLGVPSLIKTIGDSATLKKFVGTFSKHALARAIHEHFTSGKTGKLDQLGWVSPDDFHALSAKRSPSYMRGAYENFSPETKRESIRNGMNGQFGLSELPHLWLDDVHIGQNSVIIDVLGHEGRHRMDVANEYGIEQIPVQFKLTDHARKAIDIANEKGMRILLRAEDGSIIKPFNGFMNLDPTQFGRKIPQSQAGMADVRMVQALATAGISELVRGGIKAAARLRNGEEKRPVDKQTQRNADPSPQGVIDAASGETRSLGEWKATNDTTKIEDVSGMLAEGIAKLVNGNFLGQVAKNNPLVRYITDKLNNNIRMAHLTSKIARDGGVGHRATDASPQGKLDALTRKDKVILDEIADRYAGRYELSPDEIRTLGASERVVDAYKVLRDTFDKALEDVNKVRQNPIAKAPGYLARIRTGDFKLDVKDSSGKTVWSDMFDTRLGRILSERGLKDKFGDEYTFHTSMVDKENRGNPYNVTTIPFEELMATITKADPRRAAIESAARDIRARRGFGRHAIQREHIPGKKFDVEKGFQQFIDSAYQYVANMENKAFVGELMKDPDINAPNIKSWAQTYSDLSSGGYKPGEMISALSKFGENLWQVATLGNSGPSGFHRSIRAANNYFMAKALFFWRPVFAGVQLAQPFQFIPQHLAHSKAMGYDASVLRALYEGNKGLIDLARGSADPQFKAFIKDYQVPRGNIDPTMIQNMDLFGDLGKLNTFKDWALGLPPLKFIEQFGRLEASAASYHFFKNAGLKGKELFMEAENATNRMMVDYSKQERPAFVGKTGVLGTAMGPLSTFATNFWASTLMFMKDMKDNPTKLVSYQPMGIHLAQMAVWGGLTGMLGVSIADNLIDFLRDQGILNPKFQNVSERVMTNEGIPDVMTFGVPSALLDKNVSGSFASPEMKMPTAATMPGLALVSDVLDATKQNVLSKTKTNRQKLLKSIVPNSIGGLLDVYDIDPSLGNPIDTTVRRRQPGEVVPDLNRRGAGSTRMGVEEQNARLFGVRTLKETRELAAARDVQSREPAMNEAKGRLVDQAVDLLLTGKSDKDIGDLMKEGLALGMTPKQFIETVKSQIKATEQTKAERAYGITPNTLNKLDKYNTIQEYRR